MSRANQIAERISAAERYELATRHGAPHAAHDSLRAGESDAQFRTRLHKELMKQRAGISFSFSRALNGFVDFVLSGGYGGGHVGVEKEQLEESARRAGEAYSPARLHLSWDMFTRDLTVASAPQGGFLVATDVGEARDVLWPWSVAQRAGITTYERLVGAATEPKTTAKASITWLSTEGSTANESQPTLGQIAFAPKTAIGTFDMSRQFMLQTHSESWFRRHLLRVAGNAVDQAIFNGSGVSGQPLGILNTAGIQTQSGTTLGQAGVTNMKQLVADKNVPDQDIAFIGTNPVRELLENRERATGSGFVWDDDRVASRPAYTTTDLPAATLVCGGWSEVLLGLWGPGFVVELNKNDPTKFRAGIVEARVAVTCDVALAHADSFCASTSVT